MAIFTEKADVVVAGGGSAGVAAALAAARLGAKTILLERQAFLGGNGTGSLVTAFCGFFTRGQHPTQVVTGIGQEILDMLVDRGEVISHTPSPYTGNLNVPFDPEMLKCVLDELLVSSSVDLRLHTRLVSSRMNSDSSRMAAVLCSDDESLYEIEAAQFIDASGDAGLVHFAHIPTQWGDHQGSAQQASLSFRLDNLPRRAIPSEELGAAIRLGKEQGIPHLLKETGMIIKRPHDDFGYCTIPSVILTGLSGKQLTHAEIELRRQMLAYAETFRRNIPDLQHITITTSGPKLGLRETRRIIGETCLVGEHILQAQKSPDSIARAGWSPEVHKSYKFVEYTHIPDNEYASIPLGSLKVRDAHNIWAAGRIISADPMAFSSVRVMGTCFATGQAAGIAAALAASTGSAPDALSVQKELAAQHALF